MSESILIVDDDPVTCDLLREVLSKEGYNVETASEGDEALRKGKELLFDLVVTDVRMLGVDGFEVLKGFKEIDPETVIVMMTAFGSIDTAIEAIKVGAYDYISKPFNLDEMKLMLKRALEQKKLFYQNKYLFQELKTKYEFNNIVGSNAQMLEVYKTVARVANAKSTVLIQGESGTGKELIARAIHFNSQRADKPFVTINCGALVENLLESELFGHVKGAFTGAITAKKGLFELADEGTCFLDEIGDISPAMQMKLLRVLQEQEIKRVGGVESIKINVRVIVATNKNLEELVSKGVFREDLFYRLNVVSITLPPLRERKEDIPLLANHFLRKYTLESGKDISIISDEAMEKLSSYDWPGNVRELEHVIERAITLSAKAMIFPEDLPEKIRETPVFFASGSLQLVTLEELEKNYILRILSETKGNKKKAAEILGISLRNLYNIVKKHGISQNKEE